LFSIAFGEVDPPTQIFLMSEATTAIPEREKLTKKAITADHQVDRAVPCAMLNDL
jgi:hypothetical protein